MRRARARRTIGKYSTRGKRYMDFFCLSDGGIRAGYATPRLLRGLSRAGRRRVRGRVVLALTANHRYSFRGARVRERIVGVARRLHAQRPVRVGLNLWYMVRAARATVVFKVRDGLIEEVGVADLRLTHGRRAASRFLKSFY